ncbi:hypothetical protein [Nocardioides aurantiacus]|uniref:Uncharacterized protein n=1 Tax=Nocardioides aurantiacus TaxID=86796 RepID=A0A3N2CRY5_9ACTN|nr:hypothetical protein [Nocardioides aurantiacus]ROR90301.1 hypothetical protein EDD33_1137 [Nocardioides aurantiacus]
MDQLDEALARTRRDDLVAAATRPVRSPVATLRRTRAARPQRTPRADEL